MPAERVRNIDPLSVCSLYLETVARGETLGSATGFVVGEDPEWFLITNWHVVSGRHPETDAIVSSTGAVPDEIRIFHHGERLGTWIGGQVESLVDEDGNTGWIEHPQGQLIDVVAVPLRRMKSQVKVYPFDLSLAEVDMLVQPAMAVSVIGFPFGLVSAGILPIWKTGHIASDPDLDWRNLPAFLVDATTRSGMSGSPVVLRRYGQYATKEGDLVLGRRVSTRFLGVYSGRLPRESEIGIVWRPEVITEILGNR